MGGSFLGSSVLAGGGMAATLAAREHSKHMEFLWQYGLFLAKTATVLVAVLLVLARIAGLVMQRRGGERAQLQVVRLNRQYQRLVRTLQRQVLPAKQFDALLKADAAAEKARRKGPASDPTKAHEPLRHRVFVLDFKGDMRASQTAALRVEVSAVLGAAHPGDSVLVRLESPGGVVHGYGLAAAQMERLRDAGLHVTAAVDMVAASGGYMMAAVANHIIAAPFAVVGSIGVVAQIPNFYKWLQRREVDVELVTAGRHKRTLTMFGENTEEGREQMKSELQEVHELFQAVVAKYRPQLDMAEVASGRAWYGASARTLGLVDALETSDAWLARAMADSDVYALRWRQGHGIGARLSGWVARTAARSIDLGVERAWRRAQAAEVPKHR